MNQTCCLQIISWSISTGQQSTHLAANMKLWGTASLLRNCAGGDVNGLDMATDFLGS